MGFGLWVMGDRLCSPVVVGCLGGFECWFGGCLGVGLIGGCLVWWVFGWLQIGLHLPLSRLDGYGLRVVGLCPLHLDGSISTQPVKTGPKLLSYKPII